MNIQKKMQELGIQWFSDTEAETEDTGFLLKKNFMGLERPYWDGVLYGSSTFCLLFCDASVVGDLKQDFFPEGTELWLFEIPLIIHAASKGKLQEHARYLCLPVHKTNSFPSHNWNPVPINTPNDAKKHLTGWSE